MAIDRRQVKRDIKRLQRVKTWQLVVLLVLALFVAATFLRINNVGMLERRKAVEAADKIGDDEVTQERLYELQQYVSRHMNTSTGDFDLKAAYERDVQDMIEQARVANTSSHNTIWNKAADECFRQFYGNWQGSVQCIVEKQKKFPTNTPVTEIATPDPQLYRHNFLAPAWSPDFAGWSIVVCLVITLVILGRLLALGILRLLLRRHYQRV